jgi:hypothetical protein
MASEYANWAERNKRKQAIEREYRVLIKPKIVLIRCDGEIFWLCDSILYNGQRGYGKTPTEAYEAWFNDTIPF